MKTVLLGLVESFQFFYSVCWKLKGDGVVGVEVLLCMCGSVASFLCVHPSVYLYISLHKPAVDYKGSSVPQSTFLNFSN
jgi:hypothetical protein